ncbi:MAG: hypothetical protein ACI8RZ_001846 [Myxococcota bacterium]|jgi:hypothetical protein
MRPTPLFLALLLGCGDKEDTSAPAEADADTDTDTDSDTDADTDADTDTDTDADTVTVVINEIMAANAGVVVDDLGAVSDWIELHNTGNNPVELAGFTLSDDWTDPGQHVLPKGTIIGGGGWLVLWADGKAKNGSTHLPFRLNAGGEGVGLFTPDGDAVDWQVYPDQEDNTAYARIPDGSDDWQTIILGTPGSENRELTLTSLAVMESGATWGYWDAGEDPSAGWQSTGYDDSGWGSGPAPLGYGDSQSTTVSYGDNSSDKNITVWYRAEITVDETAADGAYAATLSLLCDDGCIAYLNGTELQRHNMNTGTVTADTLANATVSGTPESTYYSYDVDASALTSGVNVLSAEVHQVGATSSDTTFDLTLTVETVSE